MFIRIPLIKDSAPTKEKVQELCPEIICPTTNVCKPCSLIMRDVEAADNTPTAPKDKSKQYILIPLRKEGVLNCGYDVEVFLIKLKTCLFVQFYDENLQRCSLFWDVQNDSFMAGLYKYDTNNPSSPPILITDNTPVAYPYALVNSYTINSGINKSGTLVPTEAPFDGTERPLLIDSAGIDMTQGHLDIPDQTYDDECATDYRYKMRSDTWVAIANLFTPVSAKFPGGTMESAEFKHTAPFPSLLSRQYYGLLSVCPELFPIEDDYLMTGGGTSFFLHTPSTNNPNIVVTQENSIPFFDAYEGWFNDITVSQSNTHHSQHYVSDVSPYIVDSDIDVIWSVSGHYDSDGGIFSRNITAVSHRNGIINHVSNDILSGMNIFTSAKDVTNKFNLEIDNYILYASSKIITLSNSQSIPCDIISTTEVVSNYSDIYNCSVGSYGDSCDQDIIVTTTGTLILDIKTNEIPFYTHQYTYSQSDKTTMDLVDGSTVSTIENLKNVNGVHITEFNPSAIEYTELTVVNNWVSGLNLFLNRDIKKTGSIAFTFNSLTSNTSALHRIWNPVVPPNYTTIISNIDESTYSYFAKSAFLVYIGNINEITNANFKDLPVLASIVNAQTQETIEAVGFVPPKPTAQLIKF